MFFELEYADNGDENLLYTPYTYTKKPLFQR